MKQQTTPGSQPEIVTKRRGAAVRTACLGLTGVALQACLGTQQQVPSERPAPPPQECPAGAVEVMTGTLGLSVGERTSVDWSSVRGRSVHVHEDATLRVGGDWEAGADFTGKGWKVALRERFRVIADETGLALVPTGALTQGARVQVRFNFQDGADPAGVPFLLVVHPSDAARLIQVTRQPRSLESYREGEQEARAEARRCGEDKARLEAECSGQRGLLGLLAQGLLDEGGIADKNITKSVISRPGNTLESMKARSYRSDTTRVEGGRKVVRLTVAQQLQNNGSTHWTPGGAVLVGPKGEEWKALGVWSQEPITPGKRRSVGMEVEMTEEAARGTFTLKWWGQEAGRGSEHFDGVTFP